MESIVAIVALLTIGTIACVSIFAILSIYLRESMKFKQVSKADNVEQELSISLVDTDIDKKK